MAARRRPGPGFAQRRAATPSQVYPGVRSRHPMCASAIMSIPAVATLLPRGGGQKNWEAFTDHRAATHP